MSMSRFFIGSIITLDVCRLIAPDYNPERILNHAQNSAG